MTFITILAFFLESYYKIFYYTHQFILLEFGWIIFRPYTIRLFLGHIQPLNQLVFLDIFFVFFVGSSWYKSNHSSLTWGRFNKGPPGTKTTNHSAFQINEAKTSKSNWFILSFPIALNILLGHMVTNNLDFVMQQIPEKYDIFTRHTAYCCRFYSATILRSIGCYQIKLFIVLWTLQKS